MYIMLPYFVKKLDKLVTAITLGKTNKPNSLIKIQAESKKYN